MPQGLPVYTPDVFMWREGTKRLWDCFRDPDFREVCDAVLFKIDASPSSVIGGASSALEASHDTIISTEQSPGTPSQISYQHPSRVYCSIRLNSSAMEGFNPAPIPSVDPAALEQLTYLVEAQQANSNDMLGKLYQMHQEPMQQQIQQAQQLNASLQALLGESERYFHEVVQINQQLVGQLRDLYGASVQGNG